MTNLTRFDPFREIARFDPFRDSESPAWGRLRRLFQDAPAEPSIRIDVTENDKAFTVKAELPGVKKEDIDVQVEGNQVSISAEIKREKEEKNGDTIVHSERFIGRQYRSFTLGSGIDRKAATARFADGVLELTLPKTAPVAGERISVQ